LLSLLFVPAVFTLMDDLGLLIWRVFGRFVGGEKGHSATTGAPPPGSKTASTH
jgi:HAE1 family hydrophobic/amphiphilic exporter-1